MLAVVQQLLECQMRPIHRLDALTLSAKKPIRQKLPGVLRNLKKT